MKDKTGTSSNQKHVCRPREQTKLDFKSLVTLDLIAAAEVDGLQRRAARKHRDVTCNPHGVEPIEMGQETPKND